MRSLIRIFAIVLVSRAAAVFASDPHQLEAFKSPAPKGISAAIAAKLDENAFRISGPEGVVCEIWLVKEITTKDDFKSSLTVKYPFTPGQLLGAARLPTAGAALDFRGQELPAGVYTLRYGHQPQDGNHLGTSDVSDFGLACSSELDQDPAPVEGVKNLFKLSAKAAGTAHPAIFQMPPPAKEPYKAANLKHNDDKDLWILQVNLNTLSDGKAKPLAAQIVTVGTSGG